MGLKLDDKLVVGISSRALFDLETENAIYENEVLKAFGANIFFDAQATHTEPVSKVIPAARVPYKND